MAGTNIAAGWYPDPGQPDLERYYDGSVWTDQTRPAPRNFPPVRPPAAAAAPQVTDITDADAAPTPTPAPAPIPAPAAAPLSVQQLPQTLFRDARTSDPTAAAAFTHLFAPTAPTAAVDPHSAQALLTDVEVKVPRRRSMRAEPGWYPDPARTRNLRFYDGRGWTARTRRPADERRRHLPAAATTLQSRLLERADEHATHSRAGDRFRQRVAVIHGASTLPGMNRAVRTRAGRVGGMLSMVCLVAGIGFLSLLGWQHWLSGEYQNHVQSQMRTELTKKMEFDRYDANPTPVALPTVVTTTPPPPGTTTTPKPKSKPAPRKDPWAARPDISPLPPAGWTPPANRRVRTVKEFKNGQAIGRVVIPRMGVDKIMVAGTGATELAKGVGVATWGSLPGNPGNATLAGHRIGNGHLFYNIDKLVYGDQVIIEIPGQARAVYEVRGATIVRPDDTWVTKQTDGVMLTLTSCDPPGSTGRRFVVQAELVSGDWVDQALNRSAWHMVKK